MPKKLPLLLLLLLLLMMLLLPLPLLQAQTKTVHSRRRWPTAAFDGLIHCKDHGRPHLHIVICQVALARLDNVCTIFARA